MIDPHARRCLTIGIAIWAACGGNAAAPRQAIEPASSGVAPVVEPPAPLSAAPLVAPPAAEPVSPAPEPVVVLPPCPRDPSRDDNQKPDHVMHLVDLADAMTVVDLGSGSGYFLCHLSRAVGPHGRVIATEITKQLVSELKQRIAREQLANAEAILAPEKDVGIAPGAADRILVVNVWHHLPDRNRYAAKVARALAPGGKLVVVDFKPGNRGAGHGIMPERVLAELKAGGIDAAVVPDELSDQYVIVGSVHH